ncbi:MAG TPA: sigma-54-dependent Fis family transcriptional regulator [Rhodocyclaceae bacterium]|nr:sigma-54-dependent Fis family transcriptional regulator [Rhodocyclaceae bacterium]
MAPIGDSLTELISFLENQPEPRILMDANYRIVAANGAYMKVFGQAHPVTGRYCYEVSHHFAVPCDQAGETCPLRGCQESGESRRVLHLHHTARGEEHVDVEITPIRNPQGELTYFVETIQAVRQTSSRPAAEGLVGRSPSFNRMVAQVMRVAPTEASTLLLGETGTGKELVARMIHEASHRAAKPFVTVDCSGLTEPLFESELFGYEKGAFTGATHRKIGLVEAASGGTIFLDEIGDVPLPMQVKLLRLLESGTYRRVGGVETLRADFRLVCATHRNLKQMVEEAAFRRDLFHRINVFPIHIPSLAERAEDIPLLAESFLQRVAGSRAMHLSPAAAYALQNRSYPGNVRELRNLMERASILADGSEILPEHIVDDGAASGIGNSTTGLTSSPDPSSSTFVVDAPIPLAELEHRYMAWIETSFKGDRKALASALGLSPRTLFRKLSGVEVSKTADDA